MGLWQTPYLFGRTFMANYIEGWSDHHISKSWEPINPFEKYARQIGSSPQEGWWTYKMFETTT